LFGASSSTSSPSEDDEELTRRYSTFIGPYNSGSELTTTENKDGSFSKAKSVTFCKLCIRPFSVFRQRKTVCEWCRDPVCTECCAHSVALPSKGKGRKKVCDACFGALSGLLNIEGDFVTTVDYLLQEQAQAKTESGSGK